jgi:hypothetical protein
MRILHTQAFDLVVWEIVYHTFRGAAKLFQLWACKQVMGVAGTKEWDKSAIHKCPCCLQARDTCKHVLHCSHHGRVKPLHHTLDLVDDWLEEAETEPELHDILMEYARGRGGISMEGVCRGRGEEFTQLARKQDEIG